MSEKFGVIRNSDSRLPRLAGDLVTKDLVVYANILINDDLKFEIFTKTFVMWRKSIDFHFVIRIRGTYTEQAISFLSKYKDTSPLRGSELKLWRSQTFLDISMINSRYIFLLLEDHMPLSLDEDIFKSLIADIIAEEVDIFQYSWYPRYQNYASGYCEQEELNSKSIRVFPLSKTVHKSTSSEEFIVSLTCIFRKETLKRILKSRLPIRKDFDPIAPFNVEAKPTLDWYLPIRFAIPRAEFALCVDDDHGFTNSSGISRKLIEVSRPKRGVDHFGKQSFFNFMKARFQRFATNSSENTNASIILFAKIAHGVDVVKFSVTSLFFQFLDFRKIGKILKTD
jgi:hypothetical protein